MDVNPISRPAWLSDFPERVYGAEGDFDAIARVLVALDQVEIRSCEELYNKRDVQQASACRRRKFTIQSANFDFREIFRASNTQEPPQLA